MNRSFLTSVVAIAVASVAPQNANAGWPFLRVITGCRPVVVCAPQPVCYRAAPPCQQNVRPVCYYQQPTAVRYSCPQPIYYGQRQVYRPTYRTSSGSPFGSVNLRVSTPYAYTSPSTYSSGSSVFGGFKMTQGSGYPVPHANGGHYTPTVRLVVTH